MWLTVVNYAALGTIAAAIVTILALALTHYLFDAKTPSTKERRDSKKQDPPLSLNEHLKKHYSKENLAEIARCAVLLDKFGKERGHGDAEVLTKV